MADYDGGDIDDFDVGELSGISTRGILLFSCAAGAVIAVLCAIAFFAARDPYAVDISNLIGVTKDHVTSELGEPQNCDPVDSGEGEMCRYELSGDDEPDVNVGFDPGNESVLVMIWVPAKKVDDELLVDRLGLDKSIEPDTVVGDYHRWTKFPGIPELTAERVDDTIKVSANTYNWGPDFRDYRWGMLKPDIIEREGLPLDTESADDDDALRSGEFVIYEGELGGSRAEIGYLFNDSRELCGGMYNVSKYDSRRLAEALNEGENVDPGELEYDVDIDQVRGNVRRALTEKYGSDYTTRGGSVYVWRKGGSLISMSATKAFVRVMYLHPSCAKDLLSTGISEALFSEETIGVDL